MTTHISENSLKRIAEQPTSNMARVRACSSRGNTEIAYDVVIVNEQTYPVSLPLAGIARVDCPVCRVLIYAALERHNVAAAIAQVAP